MYYSRSEDKFYGVENTDNQSFIGTRTQIANKLLCFVIHGFYRKFTIPVAYFFSRGTSGKQLYEMTMCILHEVTNCGFNIIRLIGDNHKSNVALFRHFANTLTTGDHLDWFVILAFLMSIPTFSAPKHVHLYQTFVISSPFFTSKISYSSSHSKFVWPSSFQTTSPT